MKSVTEILNHIDELHKESRLEEAEQYMLLELTNSRNENAWNVSLTILNELAGHYRDRGMMNKALDAALESERLLDENNVGIIKERAAAYLNIANVYRAKHDLEESWDYYKKAYSVIEQCGDASLYSSYYNNLALLHQEADRFEDAVVCLKEALNIAENKLGDEIRSAISRTNLATTLIRMKRLGEAYDCLMPAISIFAGRTPSDFHYSAALSAMADLCLYRGETLKAIDYFEAALSEIELHMGKNNFYKIVSDNLSKAYDIAGGKKPIKGLSLCEKYFEAFALPIIENNFSHILEHIAIGMFGEGSECLELDDDISKDHDFGPGFIVVCDDSVSEDDYNELIKMYNNLPKTYMGVTRIETLEGRGRVGVIKYKELLLRKIHIDHLPKSNEEWASIKDEDLILLTNGKLFLDKSGMLSSTRTYLKTSQPYYVYFNKLAYNVELMAKHGQYAFKRALDRDDHIAALISKTEFIKAFLRFVHLVCHECAPYDKWLSASCRRLVTNKREGALLLQQEIDSCIAIAKKEISQSDVEDIKLICNKVNELLVNMGICNSSEDYLQIKAYELKSLANDTVIADKLVELEWELFDKTNNEGGRADCQDNWSTFSIMRRSQYYTWPIELLKLLLTDFTEATKQGRNIITEKYGYMMESTSPEQFENIKDKLPKINDDKKNIINAIVEIQIGWMEAFAQEYPNLSSNARVIHSSEDTPYMTSYETYLRGELSTYHDDSLTMYGRFIASLANNNENLAYKIMRMTKFLYGYCGL